MTQERTTPRKTQSSRVVAEQILWTRQRVVTTPMHVIKLTYLCHGWMLGIFKRALIFEPAEAWRYGPVVPSIYHAYKSFTAGPIETELIDRGEEFDSQQTALIRSFLNAYKNYSAWDLSAITHQPGTPWHQVYKDGRGEGAIIPNKLIREHYAARVAAQSQ